MAPEPLDLLGLDYEGLAAEFGRRFGKGEYHAGALFRQVHRRGAADPAALPEYAANPRLAAEVAACLDFRPPEVAGRAGDGSAYKFLLRLGDGLESESVVIPMRHYKSLCVSSQVGCAMGCKFCETARMGLLRNLSVTEIVAQAWAARHVLGEAVRNLVFMGMGEPLDNFAKVSRAIRILSDQRGLDIAMSSITVSTVGHLEGLAALSGLCAADPSPRGFRRLRLAVSLNAPDDALRTRLMPRNRLAPLAELKRALREYFRALGPDAAGRILFMEYVLMAGVNDAPEHARAVADYLRDLPSCVNLIPYNPGRDAAFARPPTETVAAFYHALMDAGQYCRVRGTKGREAMAACGQLGNRHLRKPVRAAAASPQ